MTVNEKLYKLRSMQCEIEDKHCPQCKKEHCDFCEDEVEDDTTTEWLGNHTPFRCKWCGHYSDTRTPYCAYCGKKANNYEQRDYEKKL